MSQQAVEKTKERIEKILIECEGENWKFDEAIEQLLSLIDEEKERITKVDHSIDVRYEEDVIKAFDKFIEKWCGVYSGHLSDDDENDGEFMREKIEALVTNHLEEKV